MNSLLKELCEKQNNICPYCGGEMLVFSKRPLGMSKNQWNRLERKQTHLGPSKEHVYPKGDIRRYIRSPIIAVHRKCNQLANKKFSIEMTKEYRGKENGTLLIDLLKGYKPIDYNKLNLNS